MRRGRNPRQEWGSATVALAPVPLCPQSRRFAPEISLICYRLVVTTHMAQVPVGAHAERPDHLFAGEWSHLTPTPSVSVTIPPSSFTGKLSNLRKRRLHSRWALLRFEGLATAQFQPLGA